MTLLWRNCVRSAQGLPLLLHLHHLHKGPLGGGKDPWCVCSRVQGSSCRGIRKCSFSMWTMWKRFRRNDASLTARWRWTTSRSTQSTGSDTTTCWQTSSTGGCQLPTGPSYMWPSFEDFLTQRTNPQIFEYLCILPLVPRNGGALDRWDIGVCRAQSKAVVYLFVLKREQADKLLPAQPALSGARSTPPLSKCPLSHRAKMSKMWPKTCKSAVATAGRTSSCTHTDKTRPGHNIPLSLWTLSDHLVWWHNLSFNSSSATESFLQGKAGEETWFGTPWAALSCLRPAAPPDFAVQRTALVNLLVSVHTLYMCTCTSRC